MIRELFVPQVLGDYQVIAQRVVTFEIAKTHIRVCVVYLTKTKKIVEQLFTRDITVGLDEIHSDVVIDVLKDIIKSIKNYHRAQVVLSSSLVVMKELTIPFLDEYKIKMVVPFEIESVLPFPLSDALVDSVITQQNVPEKSSTIMAVAIRNSVIDEYLQIFAQAGIIVDKVTLDLFELFSLYTMIPVYKKVIEPLIFVHIQPFSTRVVFVRQGILCGVRLIHQPIMAKELFVREIMITLEKFSKQVTGDESKRVILVSDQDQAFVDQLALMLGITLEVFDMASIRTIPDVVCSESVALHSTMMLMSLGASCNGLLTRDFTLERTNKREYNMVSAQLITGLFSLVLLLGAFAAYHITSVLIFNNEIEESENQVRDVIKKDLLIKGEKLSLDDLKERARVQVAKKANIWFSLSPQSRSSLLGYLYELSSQINKDELGLDLQKVSINETQHTMILEGRVKDFDSLRKLEGALSSSPLFKSVSKLQELDFMATITLNKRYQE
jgi:hypothetical protein